MGNKQMRQDTRKNKTQVSIMDLFSEKIIKDTRKQNGASVRQFNFR